MATSITITTGPLTASRSFANDAAAQAVLLRCAEAIGVPDGATNQQKLQQVVNWCVTQIQEQARQRRVSELQPAMLAQATDESRLE